MSSFFRGLCLPFLAAATAAYSQTNVLTQHNDIGRTGQNLTETVLTPGTVSSGNFGLRFSLPVDGQVYAQPLYVSSVTINGAAHRVVYVATEHDSVYAFDADKAGAALWKADLTSAAHGAAAGATPDPESDTGCGDIAGPYYGITGTPVIDGNTGTLYVVAKTLEKGQVVQRLHALDITTGNEKNGGPATIAAKVPGKGAGSSNGELCFNPKLQNQRAGLLLVNGTVYIAWGAHCDYSPWHGWVMAYDAATLTQTGVFVATPNGSASGIWMSGAGLAADVVNGKARMFLATGNGTYDAGPYNADNLDYGDDVLRMDLSSGIHVQDSFTPAAQGWYSLFDLDVASGGILLLPDQPGKYPHLAVQIGKSGTVYLLNRDNLGGNNWFTNNDVEEFGLNGIWGSPAYWNGNVYIWPSNSTLHQFEMKDGLICTPAIYQSKQSQTSTGSTPSISANGATGGIVWAVDGSNTAAVLYAFDATNVTKKLWSSADNAKRDGAGPAVKFVVPTVADGNVFLGADSQVDVYGLLK